MNRTFKLKYRIKSKVRFTVFLVAVILLSYAIISGTFSINAANGDSIEQYKHVNISAGDTLWSISQEYAPNDMDLREYVAVINHINNLDGKALRPGQTILVPIY